MQLAALESQVPTPCRAFVLTQVCDATAAARQRLEAQPPLRQALASLAAVGPGSPLLALSTGAVGEAAGVAEGVVFDVLLGRVRAQLQVG